MKDDRTLTVDELLRERYVEFPVSTDLVATHKLCEITTAIVYVRRRIHTLIKEAKARRDMFAHDYIQTKSDHILSEYNELGIEIKVLEEFEKEILNTETSDDKA